jgi:hypothetical protein
MTVSLAANAMHDEVAHSSGESSRETHRIARRQLQKRKCWERKHTRNALDIMMGDPNQRHTMQHCCATDDVQIIQKAMEALDAAGTATGAKDLTWIGSAMPSTYMAVYAK